MTISSRWAALVRQVDLQVVLTVAGLAVLAALAAVVAVAATSVVVAVMPE
ncbi:hypothetical protein [Lentzea flaviverrucosa]|uniref:Uncharacterized protein n=1 Tax=Lentzea flaviverrucosa TaxID=200379 RepID=A0A1H9XT78_9PSEU|nr:hypothetical protein [Lentzea flaviverrucosa]RDI19213.1 hypothetical protein DFR72_11755 [Lentzea flaviverrucosa]SES49380.1 hypothetical protein SAMN05216195_117163 [Lentzea flaviverrucosa]